MSLWELLLIAIGVSMDAFAVAVCKGLSVKSVSFKNASLVGVYFGGFQALMPLFGYFLGSRFHVFITRFDHWVAFVLLGIIGAAMIKESRGAAENLNESFDFKTMFPLAVATSIDALVIGITFAVLQVDILPAVSFIGVTTFCFSWLGIKIGNIFGSKYKSTAELLGGTILILLGTKVLLQHLLLLS